MDERMRFVIRLKDGESMAALCREFRISRKTGYKIFERYEECGLEGLTDRARRPLRYANQLPEQIEAAIVAAKREKPHWGARKIRERLLRRLPQRSQGPGSQHHSRHPGSPWTGDSRQAIAHAHRRHAACQRAPARTICGVLTTRASSCSAIERYCYPLTVTDHASRYLLLCEALESNAEKTAFTAFERLFQGARLAAGHPLRQRRSLRFAQRACSISPGSRSGGCGWASRIERIRPGHPQQNGRHERMHLTLKKEATRPAGANLLQQQAKFDAFIEEFNNERPHEALDMKCPAEVYSASCRPYRGIPRTALPVPRQDRRRHQLRPSVPVSQENQPQHLSGRPGRRRQGSRRRHLARQLHGLRSRLYRSGGKNFAAPQQPLRALDQKWGQAVIPD